MEWFGFGLNLPSILAVVSGFVSLALTLHMFRLKDKFVSKGDFAKHQKDCLIKHDDADKRLNEGRNRFTKIEAELEIIRKTMASSDDIHNLEVRVAEAAGDTKAILAALDGLKNTVINVVDRLDRRDLS